MTLTAQNTESNAQGTESNPHRKIGTPDPIFADHATTLDTASGTITISAVDEHHLDQAAPLLHRWLTHPKASFWQLDHLTPAGARDYLIAIITDPDVTGWMLQVDGEPVGWAETYEPATLLADVFDAGPDDLGMHLLVGPAATPPRHGLTDDLFAAVMRHCFDTLDAGRVVVEPDVHNHNIAAKNAAAGFTVQRLVDLPSKRAALSVCTAESFASSTLGRRLDQPGHSERQAARINPAAHLRPELMERAERHLVAKALSEFSHERLISPELLGEEAPSDTASLDDHTHDYGISLAPAGREPVAYRFRARRFRLNHWQVEESSIDRFVAGEHHPLSALDLVIELNEMLGIPEQLLSTYLEEISATLASAAYKLHRSQPNADALVDADLSTVEAAMTEGHPAFVANNGRIGFGVEEFSNYAPETGNGFRLVWLAAKRSLTELSLGEGLTEHDHWLDQLGPDQLDCFNRHLTDRGLDPSDYLWFPVHPWQWEHRISITFAVDLARQDLVLLGEGDEDFRAQQSIRTLLNHTHPERGYTKLALSIQNMGFLRGMSPEYMVGAPTINDFVAELVERDPEFAACGFRVLRERAAIGYTGDAYHRSPGSSPHRKMLAALWRESPESLGSKGSDGNGHTPRLATMAALLHRDRNGRAYASALIDRSGLPAAQWVRRYLRCYLRPLLHALEAHTLAFMPHGENLILQLEDAVPTGVFMKDIGEEVALLTEQQLPEELHRIVHPTATPERALAIFTDVFDGFFRYLAAILDTDGLLPEAQFWTQVRDCFSEYFDDHPDAEPVHDWWSDTFRHSCLNRLQLRNTLEMVDITDQSSSLLYAGELVNPMH